MTKTGQCPNCYAINSLAVRDCIECQRILPWGPAVEAQAVAEKAAQEARKQAVAQAQAQAAATQRVAPPVAPTRPPVTPLSVPNVSPGQALPINVFQVYADSFVGRFSTAFEYMDKNSALFFSLICLVVYNVCMLVGGYLIIKSFTNALSAFLPVPMPGAITPPTLTPNPISPVVSAPSVSLPQILRWQVIAMTPWLTLAISCTAARKLFGGDERHFEGDLFIAAVCLLPTGFWVLMTGLLGFSNYSLIAALGVFALSYTVLLIYRGLTTVSRVRDMSAAFCVPLVILLSSYLTQLVFTRLLG